MLNWGKKGHLIMLLPLHEMDFTITSNLKKMTSRDEFMTFLCDLEAETWTIFLIYLFLM